MASSTSFRNGVSLSLLRVLVDGCWKERRVEATNRDLRILVRNSGGKPNVGDGSGLGVICDILREVEKAWRSVLSCSCKEQKVVREDNEF